MRGVPGNCERVGYSALQPHSAAYLAIPMPPVQGYGMGRREGNGPKAPAAAPSRPTPTPISSEASAQPGGAVGAGTALSGTVSSGSSGSGPVASGDGGVGPVKYKAAGNSGGAGHVFVPARAATSNEVRQCSCNLCGPLGYLLLRNEHAAFT